MLEAVYLKFTQNLELKKNLIKTKDFLLVEHTKNDKYWGDGGG
jgi:N-glycosidase YbiA